MRIDLHTHSSVSDGTDKPSELIRKAAAVGLDIVALTDHDTFDGLDEAVAEGERIGLQVVRGMELSCSRQGESVHLLAYGADPTHDGLVSEMVRIRGGRMGRLAGVLAKLAALGVPVTGRSVGRGGQFTLDRPAAHRGRNDQGRPCAGSRGSIRPIPCRWWTSPCAALLDRFGAGH